MLGPKTSELVQLLVSDKPLESFSDLLLVQGALHWRERRFRTFCLSVAPQASEKAGKVLEHHVLQLR